MPNVTGTSGLGMHPGLTARALQLISNTLMLPEKPLPLVLWVEVSSGAQRCRPNSRQSLSHTQERQDKTPVVKHSEMRKLVACSRARRNWAMRRSALLCKSIRGSGEIKAKARSLQPKAALQDKVSIPSTSTFVDHIWCLSL